MNWKGFEKKHRCLFWNTNRNLSRMDSKPRNPSVKIAGIPEEIRNSRILVRSITDWAKLLGRHYMLRLKCWLHNGNEGYVLRSPCCVKFTICECFISRIEYVYLYKNVEVPVMYLKSFVSCLHFSSSLLYQRTKRVVLNWKGKGIMLTALRP